MKLSAQSHSSIVNAIKKALGRYLTGENTNIVTDIYLQPIQETGELVIYNDDEEELSRTVVQDWVDCTPEEFFDSTELNLKQILNTLHGDGFFNQLSLMKPYSLVMVDDEKETISELLLVDDEETLLISGELLKGLDEELDAFLKDLLEK